MPRLLSRTNFFEFVSAAISIRKPSLVVSTTEDVPTGSTFTQPSGAMPATAPMPSMILTTPLSTTGSSGFGEVNSSGNTTVELAASSLCNGASGASGTNEFEVGTVAGAAVVVVVVVVTTRLCTVVVVAGEEDGIEVVVVVDDVVVVVVVPL